MVYCIYYANLLIKHVDFKRKKEKTSLNPVGDIIEKQVKHKYTKMRCNFCLEKNIISEDRLVENDKTINNNVVIVI